MGGKTRHDVDFIVEDTRELAVQTVLATEDGSLGERGTAISALEGRAKPEDLVYACGPKGMLAEIHRLSNKIGFGAFVSFEERMACGMGMCLGCAVKGADGHYLLTCKDGPVFDVKQIRWEEI
jgi:dihydroorotate dehydrogenase electron transfer subunit